MDPSVDLTAFYSLIWNVETAVGYGLDLWGRIVGVSRYAYIPNLLSDFGFFEASSWSPFNGLPFWNGAPGGTYQQAMKDDTFRLLIMMKALSNISGCSAQDLNQILQTLFTPLGVIAYVNDLGNMACTIVCNQMLNAVELSVLTSSGAMQRPAGVSMNLVNGSGNLQEFGFAGSGLEPFGQGYFYTTNTTVSI